MTWSVLRAGRRLAALGVVFALWLLIASPGFAQTTGSKPPATTTGGTGTTTPPTTGTGSGSGTGTGTSSGGAAGSAVDLTMQIDPFIQLAADIADTLGLSFDSDLATLRFFAMVFEFFQWLEMFNSPMPPSTGGSGGSGG
jgi:hypothetical protein